MPAALLALAAAIAPPVAPVPPEKTFGTWTVACDNLRDCAGISLTETESGASPAWTVHFSRRSAPTAPVQIEAFPAFQEISPGAVTLVIDGKNSALGFNADGEAVGGTAEMLAAIAAAKQVVVVDKKGKAVGFLPVRGSSAALRWVDDQQGRAGTVTALVAKGTKPTSAVPPPPKAIRIVGPAPSNAAPKTLANAEIARIQKLSEYCSAEDNPDWVTTYYRLDAGHTVALVPCGMGAYQGNSLVVIVEEKGKWSPAVIEAYEKPYPESTPTDSFNLTEADFDQDNRLLLTMARGRGLNDCGMGASWAWDGKMFRLARYEALNVCQGAPPGTWLPRWHSANDPLADQ